MTHPRALTEQEAIDAEIWYAEYERLGTISAKCRELGITPHTLYDAIRRIRGQDTRVVREKLATLSSRDSEELAQLLEEQLPKSNTG